MSQVPQADLESWIRDCAAWLKDADSYDVLRAHKDEFLLLFGVFTRTIRYAETFLELVASGRAAEGVPVARAALEHAVTAQWVFIVDGGIQRWQRKVDLDRIEYYSKLAEWMKNGELAEGVAQLPAPPKGKSLPPFLDMLRELDKDHFLETGYKILSQEVHVTHAAVTSALEADEEGNPQLAPLREYAFIYQGVYVCAVLCMLVRWILTKLTKVSRDLAELDATSDELNLPLTLIDELPAARRRKGLDMPVTEGALRR